MHESMVIYTHSTTGITIRHNFRETNVTLRHGTPGIYLSVIPSYYSNSLYQFLERSHEQIVNCLEKDKKTKKE